MKIGAMRGIGWGIARGKKGEVPGLLQFVIFVIANIIVIGGLLYWVSISAKGISVYEQTYAKQIALMIDQAKPEMYIKIEMQDAIELAGKNNVKAEGIVKIDEVKKEVLVGIGGRGGYAMKYYTDAKVSAQLSGNGFIISITEKEG